MTYMTWSTLFSAFFFGGNDNLQRGKRGFLQELFSDPGGGRPPGFLPTAEPWQ